MNPTKGSFLIKKQMFYLYFWVCSAAGDYRVNADELGEGEAENTGNPRKGPSRPRKQIHR